MTIPSTFWDRAALPDARMNWSGVNFDPAENGGGFSSTPPVAATDTAIAPKPKLGRRVVYGDRGALIRKHEPLQRCKEFKVSYNGFVLSDTTLPFSKVNSKRDEPFLVLPLSEAKPDHATIPMTVQVSLVQLAPYSIIL
jgi:hypothetical protein